jgi:hypothetical protein
MSHDLPLASASTREASSVDRSGSQPLERLTFLGVPGSNSSLVMSEFRSAEEAFAENFFESFLGQGASPAQYPALTHDPRVANSIRNLRLASMLRTWIAEDEAAGVEAEEPQPPIESLCLDLPAER